MVGVGQVSIDGMSQDLSTWHLEDTTSWILVIQSFNKHFHISAGGFMEAVGVVGPGVPRDLPTSFPTSASLSSCLCPSYTLCLEHLSFPAFPGSAGHSCPSTDLAVEPQVGHLPL